MEFIINNNEKKVVIKNGILALNKEAGFTSFDYIYKLKKMLNIKKIGHTGTLDKEATGVLVCLLDEATSFQDALMKKGKKIYEAELVLGISTDTEDIFGNIINTCYKNIIDDIPINKIKETIKSFIGEYKQIPPMISAKKVNGKKLMSYARKNEVVERKEVLLHIDNIEIIDSFSGIKKSITNDDIYDKTRIINIRVSCSKGTYIRTLCKDIGEKLGLPSCMGRLNRIYTSGYDIKDAYTLDEINEKINIGDYSFIKPIYNVDKEQVVTFGKYELLHLGHKKIIDEVVKLAKENNIESTLILINNVNDNKDTSIISKEQRLSRLDYWGINNIFNMYLDVVSKNLSPEDFVDSILVDNLKAKHIVVGEDCRFGKDGKGNAEFLKNRLNSVHKEKNINVHIISKMRVSEAGFFDDDTPISSTYIKELISKENNEKAFKILGFRPKNLIN